MEDIKRKILVALIGEEPEEYDDERVWFYRHLEKRLGFTKKQMIPVMAELRKEGSVELVRGLLAEDESGYYGSGWMLTSNGLIEARKNIN